MKALYSSTDGELKAAPASIPYKTLVVVGLANALNQADRAIMPTAVVPLANEMGWDRMQTGWLLSSFAYGYMVMQLPSGYLSTRCHPWRMLCIAAFFWSASTVLTPVMARTGSFAVLFMTRSVMGCAEAACYPSIFQIITTSVPLANRTSSFALLIACGHAGNLVALLICPLLPKWDTMFYLFGSAGAAWCVLGVWYARSLEQPGSEPLVAAQPEEGLPEPTEGKKRDVSQYQDDKTKPQQKSLYWTLATSPPLFAIIAAHFGQNWTGYTLGSWLPTYLHSVLGVPTHNLYIVALPSLVSSVAGACGGRVADLLLERGVCSVLTWRRVATTVGLVGPAICLVAFLSARSPEVAIMITMWLSMCGAMTSSGFLSNHSDLFPNHSGLTFSIANVVGTIPGIVAGPCTAALVQAAHGSWAPVFLVAAGLNILSAVAYLSFARATRIL